MIGNKDINKVAKLIWHKYDTQENTLFYIESLHFFLFLMLGKQCWDAVFLYTGSAAFFTVTGELLMTSIRQSVIFEQICVSF